MIARRNEIEQLVDDALVDWKLLRGADISGDEFQVGDIVRVSVDRGQGDTLTRLVVVTHVDLNERHFSFLLSHFDAEFVTSTDVLVPRLMAKVFADLVVETDLFGSAFLSQVDQKFGHLDDSIMREVLAHQRGSDISPASLLKTGTVIHGEFDEKWSFKEDEARSAMLIKADFLRSLLAEFGDGKPAFAIALQDDLRGADLE